MKETLRRKVKNRVRKKRETKLYFNLDKSVTPKELRSKRVAVEKSKLAKRELRSTVTFGWPEW